MLHRVGNRAPHSTISVAGIDGACKVQSNRSWCAAKVAALDSLRSPNESKVNPDLCKRQSLVAQALIHFYPRILETLVAY